VTLTEVRELAWRGEHGQVSQQEDGIYQSVVEIGSDERGSAGVKIGRSRNQSELTVFHQDIIQGQCPWPITAVAASKAHHGLVAVPQIESFLWVS
jgi:hypothetical protein